FAPFFAPAFFTAFFLLGAFFFAAVFFAVFLLAMGISLRELWAEHGARPAYRSAGCRAITSAQWPFDLGNLPQIRPCMHRLVTIHLIAAAPAGRVCLTGKPTLSPRVQRSPGGPWRARYLSNGS